MKYLAIILAFVLITWWADPETFGAKVALVVSAFNIEMAKHERRSPI